MGGIYRRQALRSCQHGSPCLVSRSRFHSASPVCVRAGKAAYSAAPASSRTQTRFAGLCVRMRTRNTVRRQHSGLTPREPPSKATPAHTSAAKAPRVACSRELRSPQSKARPTKCLARRRSYLSRLRVQRDDVTQYRVPISAAGEGRTRHAPGTAHPRRVHLFHVFLSVLCFLPIPSCCYQSRRALSSRTTDKRKRIATASVITGLAMTTR